MWHRNPLRTIETSFLWFLSPTLTLNTIPRMVLRAIRGEGSKTQVYVSFPHSLFAWKLAEKNPAAHRLQWSAALEFTVSYVLSFLVEWRWFLSSISFDLKMRIKMCGSRCSFLPVPWSVLCSGLLPPLCSVILSHLFPSIAKSRPKSSISVGLSLTLSPAQEPEPGLCHTDRIS